MPISDNFPFLPRLRYLSISVYDVRSVMPPLSVPLKKDRPCLTDLTKRVI